MAPSLADARQRCHSQRCEERVAAKQCSQRNVIPCIKRAALRWDVDFAMLLRKARCESTLKPYAVGGVNLGLFQFNPGTWAGLPYRRHSPFSAKWSSLAAGYMHARGRGNEWSCR